MTDGQKEPAFELELVEEDLFLNIDTVKLIGAYIQMVYNMAAYARQDIVGTRIRLTPPTSEDHTLDGEITDVQIHKDYGLVFRVATLNDEGGLVDIGYMASQDLYIEDVSLHLGEYSWALFGGLMSEEVP